MLERDVAHDRLRAAGLRLTPQRRAVIDALTGDRTHPTADEVAARVTASTPGVSLSTVYKVLHELRDLGLIRAIDSAGATRFDADAQDHIHVVCDDCGLIHDAPLTPDAAEKIARSAGLRAGSVSQLDVTIHGTCSRCS